MLEALKTLGLIIIFESYLLRHAVLCIFTEAASEFPIRQSCYLIFCKHLTALAAYFNFTEFVSRT